MYEELFVMLKNVQESVKGNKELENPLEHVEQKIGEELEEGNTNEKQEVNIEEKEAGNKNQLENFSETYSDTERVERKRGKRPPKKKQLKGKEGNSGKRQGETLMRVSQIIHQKMIKKTQKKRYITYKKKKKKKKLREGDKRMTKKIIKSGTLKRLRDDG